MAFLALLSAFAITYVSVPAIINLAKLKKLYDEPNHRKAHRSRIPTLGGLALFIGFFFSFVFFSASLPLPNFNSILAALIILFVVGIHDDLFPLIAWKKLIAQIAAALIVTIQGNIRIENLYGLLGIHEMSYLGSILFTTFGILLIMNGFNLIDGVNGLAAGIATIVISTYAYWFYQMGDTVFFLLSLSLVGSLLAFLRYNFLNAKIFMGDSGSLVIGYMISLLSIRFVQIALGYRPVIFYNVAAMVYVFNLLIVPIIDTARVVTKRLSEKRSPFSADRGHLHHKLLDLGCTHAQTSLILYAFNIVFILAAFQVTHILPKLYLIISTTAALMISFIPDFLLRRKRKTN
jgi:UDP-N-acetylmuramyl pentapeptide phosphotransferase/UDP-N-acetylglucosamine-1-phosphate transferase